MRLANQVLLIVLTIVLFSCEKIDLETPTKTRMQGTWELTDARDTEGNDIKSKVAFPVTAVQLTDDNGILGTQGPMFTYVVYGGSNWVTANAKIKQAFDYANFRFNTGEFFVETGVTPRATIEAKLQATALAGGLTDILTILGVGNGFLQQVVYHKFMNVKVSFEKEYPNGYGNSSVDVMIWEFDNQTSAAYNYKDAQGNLLLWNGWPIDNFTRGKFTFKKKVKGLNEIVSENL
jgi:hypothetical protein